LNDVEDSWELKHLPDKEVEWPALRQNATKAIQRIERFIQKQPFQRRILDFGSGWGFFLAVAKEYGWDSYGLEPLPARAVYARAKFGLNITTDTLRENTFPPDFFDIITAFQVFEHLPYPGEDIHNLYKILRQGGLILIEVPNFDTWTMRIMKSHHRHFVPDHLNFFSGKTLGQLLDISGFKVVDQFQPKRYMSFHHLMKYWVRKYLPVSLSNALQNSFKKLGLMERTIGLNIGDILTVLARKL
jgi:SAM-dependent methyltransferase